MQKKQKLRVYEGQVIVCKVLPRWQRYNFPTIPILCTTLVKVGNGLRWAVGRAAKCMLCPNIQRKSGMLYKNTYVCMHVCMYACICMHMHACMHVCMYACMHVSMYPCIHVSMYPCIHVSMDVWMYGCMDVWMYGCMDVCMYGCMDVMWCDVMWCDVMWCMYVCMYIYNMCVCYMYVISYMYIRCACHRCISIVFITRVYYNIYSLYMIYIIYVISMYNTVSIMYAYLLIYNSRF